MIELVYVIVEGMTTDENLKKHAFLKILTELEITEFGANKFNKSRYQRILNVVSKVQETLNNLSNLGPHLAKLGLSNSAATKQPAIAGHLPKSKSDITQNNATVFKISRSQSPANLDAIQENVGLHFSTLTNSFRIDQTPLGRGGFGYVLKCQAVNDNKLFAIKCLKWPDKDKNFTKINLYGQKNSACLSILKEVEFISKFDHPNVVRYYHWWFEHLDEKLFEQAGFSESEEENEMTESLDFTTPEDTLDRLRRPEPTFSYDFFGHERSRNQLSGSSAFSGGKRIQELPDTASELNSAGSDSESDSEESESTTESTTSNSTSDSESQVSRSSASFPRLPSSISSEKSEISDVEYLDDDDCGIVFTTSNCSESESESETIEKKPKNQEIPSFQDNPGFAYLQEQKNRCRQIRQARSKSPKNKTQRLPWYLCIQMQLYESNLYNYLQTRNSVKVDQSLNFFHQITSGLDYIHKQGVMHRDLKPANIFLADIDSQEIRCLIGDFGLSTSTQLGAGMGAKNQPRTSMPNHKFDKNNKNNDPKNLRKNYSFYTSGIGTSMYASPEQLTSGGYNLQTDIYSLGIIFIELLYKFDTAMERATVLSEIKNHPEICLEKMLQHHFRKGDGNYAKIESYHSNSTTSATASATASNNSGKSKVSSNSGNNTYKSSLGVSKTEPKLIKQDTVLTNSSSVFEANSSPNPCDCSGDGNLENSIDPKFHKISLSSKLITEMIRLNVEVRTKSTDEIGGKIRKM